MQCASCHGPAGAGLLCQACGAILPPRAMDPFAALAVERRYDLDLAVLEGRFRELSRRLHPDRFARAPARERMLSLQAATTLNDAYRVLQKPLARAEALLALDGVTIGENESIEGDFVLEIMELREQLEDTRAAGEHAAVAKLRAGVQARRDVTMDEIAARFAENGERAEIKQLLIAVRYFDRLLEAAGEPPAAESAL